jgi:hypothetical protein
MNKSQITDSLSVLVADNDSLLTDFRLYVAFLAVVISAIALRFSVKMYKQTRLSTMVTGNYLLLKENNILLRNNPHLFELHSISTDALKQLDVSAEEVIYVLQSIQAGQMYYEVENRKKIDPIEFTHYRVNFLRSPKVRKIWEVILREKLVYRSAFVAAIDEFYKNEPMTSTSINA